MALDDIRNAVLDSARKEADRIVAAARKAADERLRRRMEEARQEAERRYQSEARAIDEEFARALVQFNGAAGKRLLEKRNERLREVFAAARRQVLEWPRDEYARVMRSLVERASDGAGGRLRIHPDDRDVFASAIDDINRGRADADRVQLADADPLTARGGFVFVTPDYEVDQTLDTLLADLERELGPQTAAELFRA